MIVENKYRVMIILMLLYFIINCFVLIFFIKLKLKNAHFVWIICFSPKRFRVLFNESFTRLSHFSLLQKTHIESININNSTVRKLITLVDNAVRKVNFVCTLKKLEILMLWL